jgi:undecaprenyl-diphosphatase
MWDILKAILQGVVQGITEWLPISSTGHLILVNEFLPFHQSEDWFDMFKVLIQLGSILAVLVLYFHKLNPFSTKKTAQQRKSTWMLWGKVAVASVPVALIGLPLDDMIDSVLSAPWVIATTLFLYGVLFLWMENRNHTPNIHSAEEMGWKTALLMGCFQALALIPGTSRSGATILGAVLLGCSRYIAAEFSFFMAIPAMFGASGLKLAKYVLLDGKSFSAEEWLLLAIGMVVSFILSLLVIRFLMNFIKKHDFKIFGYYRIVLAVVLFALIALGLL